MGNNPIRLEEIGFVWNFLGEVFENGITETLKYKKKYGNPNAPINHITPEGFRLGKWQSHQRNNYLRRKLSPDRIKRLKEVGFVWNFLDKAFENGIAETHKYKEKFGKPNAQYDYKTLDGFYLGRWQNRQKLKYRKGNLSADRVKKLEEIGFKWS